MSNPPSHTPDPLAPWETLDTATILTTPYFSITQHQMRTPSGHDATYYMHSGKDGVLCVCLDEHDNVLVARQYRPPVGRVSVDYPAGGIEPEDADPEAGIRRELLEEAGFVPATLTHLTTLDQNPGLSTSRLHIYLARGSVQQQPDFDATESIVAEFMPAGRILELIAQGEMCCVFCVSATFFAFNHLGWSTLPDAKATNTRPEHA